MTNLAVDAALCVLQDVTIEADTSDARVAALLSAMPRLRALRCTMLEDMHALLACTSLKTLHLIVDLKGPNRHRLPGVRAFLRSAVSHIENLVLQLEDTVAAAESVELVLCLGGTGQGVSALRSLDFRLYGCDGPYDVPHNSSPPPELLPLASVLHNMPHLKSLDICGAPSDDFLAALDGSVVPGLVKLEVYKSDQHFPHERAHSEQVRTLLHRYPRLHLLIQESRCDVEEKPCCPDFWTPMYCVFSHPKGQPCDIKHSGGHYEIVLT